MRTKPLVEGALLAALVALLGLLSFYTGFGWLLPIPVLLAYVRNGARNAFLVAVVGSGLMALWIGPLAAVAALGFLVPLGIVPGWTIRRAAGAGVTIGVMALALLVSGVIGALAALTIWHTNLWAQAWASLTAFLNTHAAQVKTISALTPQEAAALIARAVPVLAGAAAAVQAAGVYVLSALALRRLGHPIPSVPPFAQWRAPRATVWLYLAALGGLLLGPGQKVIDTVALNVSLGLGVVYTVIGAAASYGWLRRRGVGREMAVLAVVGGVGLLDAIGAGVAPAALGMVASLRLTSRPAPVPAGDDGEGSG